MGEPRNYPLPATDDDDRFTFGLALDVADVLTRHGYPAVTGADLVEVQQAMFRLIYQTRHNDVIADRATDTEQR